MNRFITLSTLVAAGFAGGMGLFMGPPMICNSVECGEVANLPPEKPGKGEAAKVLATLPGFLADQKSMLTHMEALRRAAIVMQGDADSTTRLFAALAERTLNTESTDQPNAAPWFDLAFFIGCLNQLGSDDLPKGIAESEGVRGYAYMKKALSLVDAGSSGEMEFGAALMVHPVMRSRSRHVPSNPGLGTDIYDRHLRTAVSLAAPGSLLETNLKQHLKAWNGSFDAVKTAAK